MSDQRHVMFAECFRDISDDELRGEYVRVRGLLSSNWREAVMREVAERGFGELQGLRCDKSKPG